MYMSYYWTTGQNLYINVVNKPFENVTKFKRVEVPVTNQNCIHEESKSSLNVGNYDFTCFVWV
jgi:hypothetical protein